MCAPLLVGKNVVGEGVLFDVLKVSEGVLMLCCSSCRSITGLWDLTVYYMTDAGWW